MADLKEASPYPYGKPRFPNLDPRAYFDPGSRDAYAQEPWHEGLSAVSPWALMGLRPGLAQGSMRPFNPRAPEGPLPKRPQGDGDSGAGQHIYEAALGRTRKPGQDVAEPGSGWWSVGGQPIPKPSNVLPWLGAGGAGYGVWNLLGGPEAWQELRETPYNEHFDMGATNRLAARINSELEQRLGVSGMPADARAKAVQDYYIPGGVVGSAPY
jgi:hypothetical protein